LEDEGASQLTRAGRRRFPGGVADDPEDVPGPESLQPDAQPANFFEETPPGEFATVVRGYDRYSVTEHIRHVEAEVRQHREQAQAMRRELAEAQRQIRLQGPPAYSGLGDRIEQLVRPAEEQAIELVQAAWSEANKIKAAAELDAAEFRAAAENETSELRANALRETDGQRGGAERDAAEFRTAARRETNELTSTTERDLAKLRATADHEVAEKRAAAERDLANLRTSTEREVAHLEATAERERDEILTTSKRQADEMRSQAHRQLDDSEAQRARAETELDIQLAARRREAQRQEAKRLSMARSAAQKLVSEAEQRASTAEQWAAKASAQADQTRRDAAARARQLVSNAMKNTDQIIRQAKSQAEQVLTETRADAERRRAVAQREVDELIRQQDSIASDPAQIRQALGGQLPMGAATQPTAPRAASTADPAPPAPPAPPSTLCDVTSTPPAPATVQPAQAGPSGAHQAAQVRPAPAQAEGQHASAQRGHLSGVGTVLRGFAVLSAATVLIRLIGFVVITLFARRAGPATFGTYSFTLALAGFVVGAPTNFGIGTLGIRKIARDPADAGKVVGEALAVQAIIAAIAVALLVALVPLLSTNEELVTLTPIVALYYVAYSMTVDWALQGLQRLRAVAAARLAGQVLFGIVTPLILIRGPAGAERYAAVFAAGAILTAIAAFAMVRSAVGPIRVSWAIAPLWDLAKGAAPLGFSLIMLQVYWSLDQVLLGLLTNKAEVGQYAVAAKLPMVISGFAQIWVSAIYPHASKLFTHDSDALRRQLGSFTSLSVVAALPLIAGSAIVGTDVMTGLFGPAYRPAGTPFAILMGASAVVLVAINYTSLAMAAGQERTFAMSVTVASIINVLLNLLLIPFYGAIGAAISTVAAESVVCLVCARRVAVVIGRPPLADRRIAGAVAATAVMSGALIAMPSSISVWLRIAAGGAVYLAVAAACGAVRREDLALLRRNV
jgi:O-antigen/teichoic acid export membrane protein/cell division septum initiation protein DivIVA